MEVANVRLRLNKVGSDVPINDVTPAEAMLLHILHGGQNGGLSFGEEFEKITITGTAKVVKDIPAQPAKGEVGKAGYVAAKAAHKDALVDRTDAEELARLRKKYGGARDKGNKAIIDSVWPDKFNPKLPQKFSDINWQEVGSAAAGLEVAATNYATGGLAQTSL